MRIYDNTRNPEAMPAHNIRRFPPYACQPRQRINIGGDFAVVFMEQLAAAGNDIFRFIVVKACGMNVLFQLHKVGFGESPDRGIFLK